MKWLIRLLQHRRMEAELEKELAYHRERHVADLIASGLDPSDAARQVRLELGGPGQLKESCRDAWGTRMVLESWWDLRYGLRTLRKNRSFTAVALISLALGIGANTAIFSLVNAILIKRLPVAEPERLVTFAETFGGKRAGVVWSLRTLDQVAKQASSFDGVFGWFTRSISFSPGDTAQWVNGEMVTGQYYRALQVKPAVGRLLNEEDVRDAEANPVCVLSYALWQREFSGDPGIVGRQVFLNGHPYRVLGVTARGFYGAALPLRFDVAVPATRVKDFVPSLRDIPGISWLYPMARMKPGVALAEAQRLTQLVLREADPQRKADLILESGSQGFNPTRSDFGQPLMVLTGIVALVLLVACANLANLLLARAQARTHELGVRLSLGASRARLIRQLLVESLLLAGGGGVAGVALSFWITARLLAYLNADRSATSALQVPPDARVLVFSVLVTILTAILFGLMPAWHATRPDIVSGLKQGSSASRALLRRSLVVIQIALSLVLVFGAGLLTRTLRSLATVDLGFQADRVIALNVDPSASGHRGAEASTVYDEILQRVRNLPNVKAASLAASTPNGSMSLSMGIAVPGYTPRPVRGDGVVKFNFVSPHYFETLGQPLLVGRDFDERDTEHSSPVAIVNDTFVRHYFDGRDPVGRKFRQGREDIEIIAVARDARDDTRRNPADTVYLPAKQGPASGLTVLVRSEADPQQIVPSLLAIVKSIDQRLPVFSVHTLDIDLDAGLTSQRIQGYLSGLFAALATFLAGVG
jgi:predicted permease